MTSAYGLTLLVDAALPGRGRQEVRPRGTDSLVEALGDEREYARTIAHLRDTPLWRRLPAEVCMHLYACEVNERLLEAARSPSTGRGTTIVIPLWPAAIFAASDWSAHAGREIEAAFPSLARLLYVSPSYAAVEEQGIRMLGRLCFDPQLYCKALTDIADAADWSRI